MRSQTITLSDTELVAALQRPVRVLRETIAQMVVHLAEMDDRQLHLAAGFPSLYAYCVEVLRLSEDDAYDRIEVARAARAFPQIVGMLSEGALNLTTIQLVAPWLTADNHQELLSAAAGRSEREVQELLARRFPQPAKKLDQPRQ